MSSPEKLAKVDNGSLKDLMFALESKGQRFGVKPNVLKTLFDQLPADFVERFKSQGKRGVLLVGIDRMNKGKGFYSVEVLGPKA